MPPYRPLKKGPFPYNTTYSLCGLIQFNHAPPRRKLPRKTLFFLLNNTECVSSEQTIQSRLWAMQGREQFLADIRSEIGLGIMG